MLMANSLITDDADDSTNSTRVQHCHLIVYLLDK